MKKSTISRLLISIFAMLTICGCRGNNTEPPMPPVQPKFAQLFISTQGTTSTLIQSIDVTIVLPSGVTVKATSDAGNPAVLVTDPGVVGVSGAAAHANASVTGIYTAATSIAPGKMMVHVATTVGSTGFTTGEYAVVNCDVAVGSFPKAMDFSLIDFKAVDLNGVAITELMAGFTANII